jgi:hypothetical protein
MDKSHVLAVNRFTDVEKYTSIGDEYVEPEQEEFVQKEHLRSWLTDPQARDQWVMYRGDDVSIFWNRKTEAPEHEYSRTVSTFICTRHTRHISVSILTKSRRTGLKPMFNGLLLVAISLLSIDKVSRFGADHHGTKLFASFTQV